MISKIFVVLQILIIGLLVASLACCDFQTSSTDNQTTSVLKNPCGLPSCSGPGCGPSGCGPSGCGPSGCGPSGGLEPPPYIEQPPPTPRESPPKPPKLMDGKELPSSTRGTGDSESGSSSEEGGR